MQPLESIQPPPASPPPSPADAPLSRHNTKLIAVARKLVAAASDSELAGLMRAHFDEVTSSPVAPQEFKERFSWQTLSKLSELLGKPAPGPAPTALDVETARVTVLELTDDAGLALLMRDNFATILDAPEAQNQVKAQFAGKTIADIVTIRTEV